MHPPGAAASLPFVHDVVARDGDLQIRLDDPDSQNPLLVQTLVSAGAPIRYIEPVLHSLEDVYLELVGAEEVGQPAGRQS